jgi:uncharacterized protein YndB with AHSA1/START domain
MLMFANWASAEAPQATEGFINAPVSEVWRLFTTPAGYQKMGVAHSEVDLRVGGSIRNHYDPKGALGDSETIVNEILAFEPERMLALRIRQAPASFPFRDAIAGPWTVIYFSPAGADMTQVRVIGLGYGDSANSQAMRRYFEKANKETLDRIAKPYWPQCAVCKQEAEPQ